jgi:hypothetical protein
MIGLGTGENANDKIEIRRREPRPTIRLDHRGFIMSITDAAWQALSQYLHAEEINNRSLIGAI